tara:strand:+ start:89 stop:349 length:261 start_codon:yes stop_codon:yes gene_type:complete
MTTDEIIELIEDVLEKKLNLNSESTLLGGEEVDSMSLVQICIRLEEEADKNNFEFDWTSEKAMSNINSMFKTIQSLTDEFNNQKNK